MSFIEKHIRKTEAGLCPCRILFSNNVVLHLLPVLASADFNGGDLSSDIGPLLLRGVDQQIGLTARRSNALNDTRHPTTTVPAIFEGLNGALVTAVLRPGKRPTGAENAMILQRVLKLIRNRFQDTHILVRGAKPWIPTTPPCVCMKSSPMPPPPGPNRCGSSLRRR